MKNSSLVLPQFRPLSAYVYNVTLSLSFFTPLHTFFYWFSWMFKMKGFQNQYLDQFYPPNPQKWYSSSISSHEFLQISPETMHLSDFSKLGKVERAFSVQSVTAYFSVTLSSVAKLCIRVSKLVLSTDWSLFYFEVWTDSVWWFPSGYPQAMELRDRCYRCSSAVERRNEKWPALQRPCTVMVIETYTCIKSRISHSWKMEDNSKNH